MTDYERKINSLPRQVKDFIIEEEGYLNEDCVDLYIAMRDSGNLDKPIDLTETDEYLETVDERQGKIPEERGLN